MSGQNINDDILNMGFGGGRSTADTIVIDVEPTVSPGAPSAKKKKMKRVLSIAGAGIVLLSIAAGAAFLQSKPIPVDPAVEAILSKPPTPQPPPEEKPTDAAKVAEDAAAKPPAMQDPLPAPTPSVTPPVVLAPPAAPTPTPPVVVAPPPPVVAPVAAAPVTVAPPVVDTKSQATADDNKMLKRRLDALDSSYLTAVETIGRLSAKVAEMSAVQADLKAKVDKLAKANEKMASAQSDERPVAAKKPAEQKVVEKSPKQEKAEKLERVEKAVSMKEFHVLAMTTESVIVGTAGKEQEIFIGSLIPGLNGKLEKVDPVNHKITTSTRIYTFQ